MFTPHGTITMTVPAGTSSGKRIRAKGYGVRTKDGTRGDLYAEIPIAIPKSIDEASAELSAVRESAEGIAAGRAGSGILVG
jgi:curved DNA-binding protein